MATTNVGGSNINQKNSSSNLSEDSPLKKQSGSSGNSLKDTASGGLGLGNASTSTSSNSADSSSSTSNSSTSNSSTSNSSTSNSSTSSSTATASGSSQQQQTQQTQPETPTISSGTNDAISSLVTQTQQSPTTGPNAQLTSTQQTTRTGSVSSDTPAAKAGASSGYSNEIGTERTKAPSIADSRMFAGMKKSIGKPSSGNREKKVFEGQKKRKQRERAATQKNANDQAPQAPVENKGTQERRAAQQSGNTKIPAPQNTAIGNHNRETSPVLPNVQRGAFNAVKEDYGRGNTAADQIDDMLVSDRNTEFGVAKLPVKRLVDAYRSGNSYLKVLVDRRMNGFLDPETMVTDDLYAEQVILSVFGNSENPVYAVIVKYPTGGPSDSCIVRVEVHEGDGILINPTSAKILNADFDSDHATVSFNPEYLRAAPYLSEQLISTDGILQLDDGVFVLAELANYNETLELLDIPKRGRDAVAKAMKANDLEALVRAIDSIAKSMARDDVAEGVEPRREDIDRYRCSILTEAYNINARIIAARQKWVDDPLPLNEARKFPTLAPEEGIEPAKDIRKGNIPSDFEAYNEIIGAGVIVEGKNTKFRGGANAAKASNRDEERAYVGKRTIGLEETMEYKISHAMKREQDAYSRESYRRSETLKLMRERYGMWALPQFNTFGEFVYAFVQCWNYVDMICYSASAAVGYDGTVRMQAGKRAIDLRNKNALKSLVRAFVVVYKDFACNIVVPGTPSWMTLADYIDSSRQAMPNGKEIFDLDDPAKNDATTRTFIANLLDHRNVVMVDYNEAFDNATLSFFAHDSQELSERRGRNDDKLRKKNARNLIAESIDKMGSVLSAIGPKLFVAFNLGTVSNFNKSEYGKAILEAENADMLQGAIYSMQVVYRFARALEHRNNPAKFEMELAGLSQASDVWRLIVADYKASGWGREITLIEYLSDPKVPRSKKDEAIKRVWKDRRKEVFADTLPDGSSTGYTAGADSWQIPYQLAADPDGGGTIGIVAADELQSVSRSARSQAKKCNDELAKALKDPDDKSFDETKHFRQRLADIASGKTRLCQLNLQMFSDAMSSLLSADYSISEKPKTTAIASVLYNALCKAKLGGVWSDRFAMYQMMQGEVSEQMFCSNPIFIAKLLSDPDYELRVFNVSGRQCVTLSYETVVNALVLQSDPNLAGLPFSERERALFDNIGEYLQDYPRVANALTPVEAVPNKNDRGEENGNVFYGTSEYYYDDNSNPRSRLYEVLLDKPAFASLVALMHESPSTKDIEDLANAIHRFAMETVGKNSHTVAANSARAIIRRSLKGSKFDEADYREVSIGPGETLNEPVVDTLQRALTAMINDAIVEIQSDSYLSSLPVKSRMTMRDIHLRLHDMHAVHWAFDILQLFDAAKVSTAVSINGGETNKNWNIMWYANQEPEGYCEAPAPEPITIEEFEANKERYIYCRIYSENEDELGKFITEDNVDMIAQTEAIDGLLYIEDPAACTHRLPCWRHTVADANLTTGQMNANGIGVDALMLYRESTETHVLKQRKKGLSSDDTIVKHKAEDLYPKRSVIEEKNRRVQDAYERDGISGARRELASQLQAAHHAYGYTMPDVMYLSLAHALICEYQTADGNTAIEVLTYNRLKALMDNGIATAQNAKGGALTPQETQHAAIAGILEYNPVENEATNDSDFVLHLLDNLAVSSKTGGYTGATDHWRSSEERNAILMKEIQDDIFGDNFDMDVTNSIEDARRSIYNAKENKYLLGMIPGDKTITRIIRSDKDADALLDAYECGPAYGWVIDGNISDSAMASIRQRAYRQGVTLYTVNMPISWRDVVPITLTSGKTTIYGYDTFDARLNGRSSSVDLSHVNVGTYVADDSSFSVMVKDDDDLYQTGDSGVGITDNFANRMHFHAEDVERISIRKLFSLFYGLQNKYQEYRSEVVESPIAVVDDFLTIGPTLHENGRPVFDDGSILDTSPRELAEKLQRFRERMTMQDNGKPYLEEVEAGEIVALVKCSVPVAVDYGNGNVSLNEVYAPVYMPAKSRKYHINSVRLSAQTGTLNVDWSFDSTLQDGEHVKIHQAGAAANKLVNTEERLPASRLQDGTQVDMVVNGNSITSRIQGNEILQNKMSSVFTKVRIGTGYNLGMYDNFLPEDPTLPDGRSVKQGIVENRLSIEDWKILINDGNIVFFDQSAGFGERTETMNAFVKMLAIRAIHIGINPTNAFASTFNYMSDGSSKIHWQYRAMFEPTLDFAENFRDFVRFIDPNLRRPEDGGMMNDQFQFLVPFTVDDETRYKWCDVYYGLHFANANTYTGTKSYAGSNTRSVSATGFRCLMLGNGAVDGEAYKGLAELSQIQAMADMEVVPDPLSDIESPFAYLGQDPEYTVARIAFKEASQGEQAQPSGQRENVQQNTDNWTDEHKAENRTSTTTEVFCERIDILDQETPSADNVQGYRDAVLKLVEDIDKAAKRKPEDNGISSEVQEELKERCRGLYRKIVGLPIPESDRPKQKPAPAVKPSSKSAANNNTNALLDLRGIQGDEEPENPNLLENEPAKPTEQEIAAMEEYYAGRDTVGTTSNGTMVDSATGEVFKEPERSSNNLLSGLVSKIKPKSKNEKGKNKKEDGGTEVLEGTVIDNRTIINRKNIDTENTTVDKSDNTNESTNVNRSSNINESTNVNRSNNMDESTHIKKTRTEDLSVLEDYSETTRNCKIADFSIKSYGGKTIREDETYDSSYYEDRSHKHDASTISYDNQATEHYGMQPREEIDAIEVIPPDTADSAKTRSHAGNVRFVSESFDKGYFRIVISDKLVWNPETDEVWPMDRRNPKEITDEEKAAAKNTISQIWGHVNGLLDFLDKDRTDRNYRLVFQLVSLYYGFSVDLDGLIFNNVQNGMHFNYFINAIDAIYKNIELFHTPFYWQGITTTFGSSPRYMVPKMTEELLEFVCSAPSMQGTTSLQLKEECDKLWEEIQIEMNSNKGVTVQQRKLLRIMGSIADCLDQGDDWDPDAVNDVLLAEDVFDLESGMIDVYKDEDAKKDYLKALEERRKQLHEENRKRREKNMTKVMDKDGNIIATDQGRGNRSLIGSAVSLLAKTAQLIAMGRPVLILCGAVEHVVGINVKLRGTMAFTNLVHGTKGLSDTSALFDLAENNPNVVDAVQEMVSALNSGQWLEYQEWVKGGKKGPNPVKPLTIEQHKELYGEDAHFPRANAFLDRQMNKASRWVQGSEIMNKDDAKKYFQYLWYMIQRNPDFDMTEQQFAEMVVNDTESAMSLFALTDEGERAAHFVSGATIGGGNWTLAKTSRFLREHPNIRNSIVLTVMKFPSYTVGLMTDILPFSQTFQYLAVKLGTNVNALYQDGRNQRLENKRARKEGREPIKVPRVSREISLDNKAYAQLGTGIIDCLIQDSVVFASRGIGVALIMAVIEAIGFEPPDKEELAYNLGEYKIGTNLGINNGEGVSINLGWVSYDLLATELPMVAAIMAYESGYDPWKAFVNTAAETISAFPWIDITETIGSFVNWDATYAQTQEDLQSSWGDDVPTGVAYYMQLAGYNTFRTVSSWFNAPLLDMIYNDALFFSPTAYQYSNTMIWTTDPTDDSTETERTTWSDYLYRQYSNNHVVAALLLDMSNFGAWWNDGIQYTSYFKYLRPVTTYSDPTNMTLADKYDVGENYYDSDEGHITGDAAEIVDDVELLLMSYDNAAQVAAQGYALSLNTRYACQLAWGYEEGGMIYELEARKKYAADLLYNADDVDWDPDSPNYVRTLVEESNAEYDAQIEYYEDLLDRLWDENIPYGSYKYYAQRSKYRVYYTNKETGETGSVLDYALHPDQYETHIYNSGVNKSVFTDFVEVVNENKNYNEQTTAAWYNDLTDLETLITELDGQTVPSGIYEGYNTLELVFGNSNADELIETLESGNIPDQLVSSSENDSVMDALDSSLTEALTPTAGQRNLIPTSETISKQEALAALEEEGISWDDEFDYDAWLEENGLENPWDSEGDGSSSYSSYGYSSYGYSGYGSSGYSSSSGSTYIYSNVPYSLSGKTASTMYNTNLGYTNFNYLNPAVYTTGSRSAYRRSN